ncbi:MAG: TIM barrel protein [Planctomycetota bacterium]|jgi:sugar phosphate isomerase/epimerase|nr:TIM barrel protein [Planctomycetota bacterium]
MPVPLSIQLYTLREQMAAEGPASVIQRLGAIGYSAVEGGVPKGLSGPEWRAMVEDQGMHISCGGCGVPTADSVAATVTKVTELGVRHAMCGYGPEHFADLEAIKRTAEALAIGYELMADSGITLCLHNHAWEFERIDGRLKQDILIELCPAVQFELDVYWATNHGTEDAAAMVTRVADRTPMLHLKDGMLVKDEAMLACGAGKQNFPAIMAAADPQVLVAAAVELDRYDGDMWDAVTASHAYLTGAGLVQGR